MTEIRAIVSDFGGVLTSPMIGSFLRIQEAWDLPLEALGRAMQTVTERDGANPLFELECGRLAEAEFLAKLGDALRDELGRDVPMHAFTEEMWRALQPNHAVFDLFCTLRDEGYRMALLTNNVREWESRWRSMFPIDEVFEVVVDSAFVGMRKPDPRIYELTVGRVGLPAEQCLFIDDMEINVTAAQDVGMAAVHFRENEQAIADIHAALGRDAA
ncbi:MAG: HAD family phosphatase [Solirubrobacteraceae bacterium]|nr:HAD family phosphatase [Solirubrobacteraceae bacterium]